MKVIQTKRFVSNLLTYIFTKYY